MNKFVVLSLVLVTFFTSCKKEIVDYVNPFIGTGGHGHTFPGATLPFGMVQLSPDTRNDDSWDGSGGYHYNDSVIYGFSHTHLSGTGVSDYGDFLLMPVTQTFDLENADYKSTFSHDQEEASAGCYSVNLDNGVEVELTATTRCGMHHYVFPENKMSVIIDLHHRDELLAAEIKVIDDHTLSLKRVSAAWARQQHAYGYLKFSIPFKITLSKDQRLARLDFESSDKSLLAKLGFSFVDVEGAQKNLEAEIPAWDFNEIKLQAIAAWQKELLKIEVKSEQEKDLTIFYTALYHTMIHPNIASDVDQRYRGMDMKIHKAKDFDYYTVFSLWDTFRATHPLYTLIDRKRSLDFIKTFLAQYQQGGRLPVWELASNETDCMIGYHSVSVITDAVAKDITGFDLNLAFEAAKKSARWDHLGLPYYSANGHLSVDAEHESVSKTLEYAYDDWCIAQLATKLNKTDDYYEFIKRSSYWKNLYDPSTGFMRPRKNGNWLSPFEAREVNNHYTEANSWQYSFFVPQDIYGLIELSGGPEAFEQKLDSLFAASTQTTGREQADITGLIGQYAHGNEPSHHIAYLYQFVEKPEKTRQLINKIISEFYTDQPDGLIGNEDCGQMSAWYVLSSIGLYQVTPGTSFFLVNNPHFEEVKINLENGNTLIFDKKGQGNVVPKQVTIKRNGVAFPTQSHLAYNVLMEGGTFVFEANKTKNANLELIPPKEVAPQNFVVNPIIEAASASFVDSLWVKLYLPFGSFPIYYTIDGSDPIAHGKVYLEPILVTKNTVVKAVAIDTLEFRSFVTEAKFYKIPSDYKVTLLSQVHPQYRSGGENALIDGIRGNENWRKGEWIGVQGNDFEALVTFNKARKLKSVGIGLLQDSRSWILYPTQVELFGSKDGVTFTPIATKLIKVNWKDEVAQMRQINFDALPSEAYTVIKLKAKHYGLLPKEHRGAGFPAYVFVDEIIVK